MKRPQFYLSLFRRTLTSALFMGLLAGARMFGQNCTVGNDLDSASKAAIESATTKFFNAAQAGDTNLFRQNSVPVIQQNFAQLEPQLMSAKEALAGGQPTLRNYYLLESTGAANQEFLCGVYGMADFVAFTPQNLPAGKFAVSLDTRAVSWAVTSPRLVTLSTMFLPGPVWVTRRE